MSRKLHLVAAALVLSSGSVHAQKRTYINPLTASTATQPDCANPLTRLDAAA